MKRVLEPEVMDTAEEAHAYDTMDHSGPNEAFVLRLIELGASGQMLDIGTGPGHIPLMVCERDADCHITGIDLSENMLAIADRYREASPHRSRLVFEVADAKGLGYEDASFDTVFSNTILHHIPSPESFLREALRVLRPGGVLLIRDLYRPPSAERVDELVELYAAKTTNEQRELYRASLFAAFAPGEFRVLADRAGLGAARLVIDTDRHMSLELSSAAS